MDTQHLMDKISDWSDVTFGDSDRTEEMINQLLKEMGWAIWDNLKKNRKK